ncbi:MAG: hypothetical protein ABI703_07760 [Gemmatimonadales bacterium]
MTQGHALAVHPHPQRLRLLLLLLPLLGCGHTEPFGTPPTGTDQPFNGGPPVRLTYNPGPDRNAVWLPDGSGILYSTQQLGRRDHDVCLALLPPGGGSQRQLTCDLSPTGADTVDAIESPAPAADGRLAFVGHSSRPGTIPPGSSGIYLGSLSDPANRATLRPIPYTIPGGPLHSDASQLRWLSGTRLLYLGERVDFAPHCDRCAEWDTTTTGLNVVSLDVTQPGGTPQLIPGTDNASGLSRGADEDEIYFTLSGDARVYRQTLSTGAVGVAHDFGPAGVARDVHVVGSRMAAVVGGRVVYGADPRFGPTQWDSGGVLHVVDLSSGQDQVLDGPGLFRRPQVSPSGSALVVEMYPLEIGLGDPPDTLVSRRGDLFLYDLP